MKKLFLFFLSAVLIFCAAGCTAVNEVSVGSINGTEIPVGEYNFFLNSVKNELLLQAGVEVSTPEFWENTEIDGQNAALLAKEKAFEQVALFRVKLLKAQEAGYSLSESEKAQVQAQYETLQETMGGKSAFEKELQKIGVPAADYRRIMENNYLLQKYTDDAANDPSSQLYISREDMEQFYEGHKEEYISSVTVKQIFFSTVNEQNTPLSNEEIYQIKETADNVYTQIIQGAEFDALMLEYSQDPVSAQYPDGYTIQLGDTPSEFENVAFHQEAGAVSTPVKSAYGYHIIKTLSKEYRPLEEIENTIFSQLLTEKYDQLAESWKASYSIQMNEEAIKSIPVGENSDKISN